MKDDGLHLAGGTAIGESAGRAVNMGPVAESLTAAVRGGVDAHPG